jgi:hypothetical protein
MGNDGRRGTSYRHSARGGGVLGADVGATWDPVHSCRGAQHTDRWAKGNLSMRIPGVRCGEVRLRCA